MPKQRGLTPESFELLLAWLDPDRDKAGGKYEAIRHRLVTYFTGRGCLESDVLADYTINVVAGKLPALAERYEGDPAFYFYGVAKKVLHEHLRDGRRKTKPPSPRQAARTEGGLSCVEECMERLPTHSRRTFEEYHYRDEPGRRKLAEELGISVNALRIRVHRVRAGLQSCVEDCLERKGE